MQVVMNKRFLNPEKKFGADFCFQKTQKNTLLIPKNDVTEQKAALITKLIC